MNNILSSNKLPQASFKANPTEDKEKVYPQWAINSAKITKAGNDSLKTFPRDVFIACGGGGFIGALLSYKEQKDLLKKIADKEVISKSFDFAEGTLKANIADILKKTKTVSVKHMAINAAGYAHLGLTIMFPIACGIMTFSSVKEFINICRNKDKKQA